MEIPKGVWYFVLGFCASLLVLMWLGYGETYAQLAPLSGIVFIVAGVVIFFFLPALWQIISKK